MYNSKYPSVSLNLYRITHDNPAKTKGGTVPTTETGWRLLGPEVMEDISSHPKVIRI